MSEQGQRIFNGRYELHRRLGRGGMAEVFLARDQLLDRPVAVKVLFPELAADPGFVERFRREAQSAANLNHPNIVGVYDWGEADGTYFIVMEYVDGRTLSDILRSEGPLHPDRAADITADVAAALGFAHRNGVVHRDVKPGNVLITTGGQVKLADFGIGRVMEEADQSLTQTGAVMGTATYFSPEQAQGHAVDPRSDIYSLGCVLYEMLTSRPPFSGDSPIAIAYKHVQESPVPPRQHVPDLSPAIEAIVLKTLAKNPVNRYPSAEDLRADLRRFREGHRILAESVMAPPVDPGATMATQAVTGYGDATAMSPAAAAYLDDDEPEPRRGAFALVLLGLLVVVAVLLFLLARSLGIGDDDDPSVAQVAVPNVIDKTIDDAERILTGAKLEVDVEFEDNDEVDENVVFAQDPVGGVRVDEGSVVRLRVSQGAAAVPVPDVRGKPEDQARRILGDAGFLVTSSERADDEVEAGSVIEQDPAPDEEAPEGTTVDIVVSTGPEASAVPDVSGQTVSQARSTLEDRGWVVSVREEASDSVDEGRVIRTEPGAGTEVPKGDTVVLVVSTGRSCQVPGVEGLGQAAAESQLTAAGYQPSVTYDTLPPGHPDDGRVRSQTPGEGANAACGSTVSIVVGDAADDTTTSPVN